MRDIYTLFIEVNKILIYETGKQINIAGGKGKEFIDENLARFEVVEEFEINEFELYKKLKVL